jgi:glutathionyl-hydroquinone reductase
MVKGIDQFRAHFENFNNRYVLIGGAACYLAMEEVGLEFRVTKDLDIVLCVEALDTEFVGQFWDFIKKGRYQNRQKSTGKKLLYRFYGPECTGSCTGSGLTN